MRFAIVLLALLTAGCGQDVARALAPRSEILLVGGNVFGGSERVADLLNDAGSGTGVFGSLRFVVEAHPGLGLDGLPAVVAGLDEAAAAVLVFVGDLATLVGVDPNHRGRRDPVLSRRTVDADAVRAVLDELDRVSADRGLPLIYATHPLGLQGRIEVPELMEVADIVRERTSVLDAAAVFAAVEPPCFVNGIDELDAYGHDILALTIYDAALDEPGLLPPDSPRTRGARRDAAALRLWLRGPGAEARAAFREVLATDPTSPSGAARQAAMASVLDGLVESRARWEAITPERSDEPGLAVGLALSGLPTEPLEPRDPLERSLLRLVDAALAASELAVPEALATVGRHPERLEAWIGLQLADRLSGATPVSRGEILLQLSHYESGPLRTDRAAQLLVGTWPRPLGLLPALLAASRPYKGMLPRGPALQEARRLARLGLPSRGIHVLERAEAQHRLPSSWRAVLADLRNLEQER